MALAVAVACLASSATTPSAHAQTARRAVTVKHPPIPSPGDTSWSAQQNMIDSKRYEQMLRTNCLSGSAAAEGMRRDHYSGASRKLPRQLQSRLIPV